MAFTTAAKPSSHTDDWLSTEHSMGTSIFAVTFDGGVVVGADSRTTTGAYIANRVSDKLTPLADKIYCCRSGSAADTQAVTDYVKLYIAMREQETGEATKVSTAARLGQQICYQNKDALSAGLIIGGWDEVDGGSLYSIPLGGSCVSQPYCIGGSGSTYIYGFCDDYYRENFDKDGAIEFVSKGLSLAMARDGSSGGVIRLAIITADGVERIMLSGDELPKSYSL